MNIFNALHNVPEKEFGGKKYVLEKVFPTKAAADAYAKEKRKDTWHGYSILARVAKTQLGYGVYTLPDTNVRYAVKRPKARKDSEVYWDGSSWVRKGFHRDSHGVIVWDSYPDEWKLSSFTPPF